MKFCLPILRVWTSTHFSTFYSPVLIYRKVPIVAQRRPLHLPPPPPRPPTIGTRPVRIRSAKLCQESTLYVTNDKKGDNLIKISWRGSMCVSLLGRQWTTARGLRAPLIFCWKGENKNINVIEQGHFPPSWDRVRRSHPYWRGLGSCQSGRDRSVVRWVRK